MHSGFSRTKLVVIGTVLLLLAAPAPDVWSQLTGPGLDSAKAITQYRLDVWQTEQGLPQTTVYSITQTPDGFLWLGTQAGLTRFDGVTFNTSNPAKVSRLRDQYTTALLTDRDGNLWIGTSSGGISRMTDGAFISVEDDQSSPSVDCLYQDRSGTIWAGTTAGLLRLENGRFHKFPGIEGHVYALHQIPDGALLIAAEHGVFVWTDSLRPLVIPRGISAGSVRSILQDRKGNLWIGTTSGVVRAGPSGVARFSRSDGLPGNEVVRLIETRNGQIWLGTTSGGLARYRQGRFEALLPANGLEGSDVSALFEDREGSLWVGTANGGLNRLRDPIFTTFGVPEGLPTNMLWSVYGARDGALWIGTDRSGLLRFRDGHVRSFTPANGFPSGSVYAMLEAADGTLWLGGDKGLIRLRNGRWEDLSRIPGGPTGWVSSIHQDRTGAIWIGAESGLYRWKDGRIESLTGAAGIKKTRVWTIAEDSSGTIWVATTGEGLLRYSHDRFTTFTTKDGLSNDAVHALYADQRGLWIGTLFGGLNLLREGQIVTLPFAPRPRLSDLYGIQADDQGYLWLSSSQGLYRVAERQLVAAADGQLSSLDVHRFDELDGLRRTEFNGAGLNASWRSPDGRLWFPSIQGLVVIDPNNLVTNPLAPPVHIDTVLVDGHAIDTRAGLELQSGGSGLEIRYTAGSLLIPQRVTFRYKLEGYDKDWVEAGTRRVAYYTGVAGGRYRFRVSAANNDGVWNHAGATLDFRVRPRFRETIWFKVLCAVVLAALGTVLLKLRHRTLTGRARMLGALVDERTAELRTSEERYRELFDANPQAVWVYDRETLRFLAVNSAAVRHYGYSREEFLEMTLNSLRAPVDEPRAPELHAESKEWPLPTTTLYRNRSGDLIEVEEAIHEIIFAGRPACLVVASDVTARRDLEERLRHAQKMEAIGQLTGGIAHDLNNVLTAVIAHVDLAVATLSPDPDMVADLTQAQAAAHRGAGIIRKLMGFSRRERLVLKPLDLGQFVREFAGTMRRLLPAHIDVSIAVDEKLPPVLADASTVQQMLLNLATNARDAMPDGGRLQVQVRRSLIGPEHVVQHGWGEAGSFITLAVADTGIGMNAETRAKVFEPFFSTKSKGQGTGLGMAMVYGLIKQHQGYVLVNSEPGQGTEVRLYFPISADAIQENTPAGGHAIPRGHETVLIVEDEPAVRAAGIRALKRFGYRVLVASDGEEGLRLWRERKAEIDLVISDAIMPRMGGLALYEAMSTECPGVRFLLMSGYTGEEVSQRATYISAVPFLAKPWTVTELLAAVRHMLNDGSVESAPASALPLIRPGIPPAA